MREIVKKYIHANKTRKTRNKYAKKPAKNTKFTKNTNNAKSVKTAKNAKLQQGKNAIFMKSNKFEYNFVDFINH